MWQPATQPASHVAVAITLNAKASSLKIRFACSVITAHSTVNQSRYALFKRGLLIACRSGLDSIWRICRFYLRMHRNGEISTSAPKSSFSIMRFSIQNCIIRDFMFRVISGRIITVHVRKNSHLSAYGRNYWARFLYNKTASDFSMTDVYDFFFNLTAEKSAVFQCSLHLIYTVSQKKSRPLLFLL